MININDVTMIIPHFGSHPDQCRALYECLVSLHETSPELKIIVAKNGRYYCKCLRDLQIEVQGQNMAVNAAVQITKTPWIMVSNDDMIYSCNWFNNLTDPLTTELCISPKLVEPRPGAPTFDVHFCGGAGGDFKRDEFDRYVFSKGKQTSPLRNGFNLPFLIHKKLWNIVGGYDIAYDPWGSNGDSDLLYKIRLAGIQPKQNQNCFIYHFSQTSGTFEPKNDHYRLANYKYFKEVWGFDRTDERIWEADFTMPDKERIFRPEWEGKYL